jgi:hypothetical protein
MSYSNDPLNHTAYRNENICLRFDSAIHTAAHTSPAHHIKIHLSYDFSLLSFILVNLS